MFSSEITNKAHQLLKSLRNRGIKLATAESCTGGLASVAITELPGSSEIFDRGFVTYSNESKIELLTVPTYFIDDFGAISMETAMAMAEGALLMSKADISVSITGIAGPDGGSDEKPVGTVFIATAFKGKKSNYQQHLFTGNRHSIRLQAVESAFDMLLKRIQ